MGRRHVRTLTRHIGIETPCRKPTTSKPARGRKICPYLLRDLAIMQLNQV